MHAAVAAPPRLPSCAAQPARVRWKNETHDLAKSPQFPLRSIETTVVQQYWCLQRKRYAYGSPRGTELFTELEMNFVHLLLTCDPISHCAAADCTMYYLHPRRSMPLCASCTKATAAV